MAPSGLWIAQRCRKRRGIGEIHRETTGGAYYGGAMKLKRSLSRSKSHKNARASVPMEMEAALRYHQQGDLRQAEAAYRALLGQGAVAPVLLNNLALICRQTGRFPEALALFERACSLAPGDPLLLNNLASEQMRSGLLDKAADSLAKAIAANPSLPGPHVTLGNLHRKQGRFTEAFAAYEQAHRLAPRDPGIHNNLGMVARDRGEFGKAEEWFVKALSLAPGAASTFSNLGLLYLEQGQTAKAIACYDQALRQRPDWDTAWDNKLMGLCYQSLPKATVAEAHRQWGERHGKLLAQDQPKRQAGQPARSIRIGYVSADFRRHSVSCFMEPVLAHHDRTHFEVYCYANVARPDEVTECLKSMATWRDIAALSDDEAARLVREDKIDVLVDLSGHTEGNRLLLFARKPAPVQATYLGYPNTTGLATIDYRLTDGIADPAGEEEYHTEKLERLPSGFLCYQPAAAPAIVARPPGGEGSGITFGSFNTLAKNSPEVLRCWVAILNKVPGSRLLLKYKPLADEGVRARIREEFGAAGLSEPEKRLVLKGHVADTEAHFAMYNQIDLALDTFPYNGATTTFEALWMGVPVITLATDRHVGRVGASILNRIGRGDWVAGSEEEYVAKAVALAQDHGERGRCHQTLRECLRNSPLMDGPAFCRELEEVYRRWLV
jgi:predicted O-linked N-acetylglucosamine transferase (SPINDLY family)